MSSAPIGGEPTPGNGTPGSDGPVFAAARAAIDAANLANESSLAALDAIRFTDEGAAAAAAAIQAGAGGDALWAATWIYATAGTDPDVLAPLLSNPDSTVRALAAAAMLSWGRQEAARVLVDLLGDASNVRGAEPPQLSWEFAAATLARYIDGPELAAGATREDAAAAWTTWLNANEGSMAFDADTGRWRAP